MYDLPGVWEVSATHRYNPGTAPISMAHIGNRFVLLEKDGLSDSCRCLLKVHHSEGKLPNSTSAAMCIELSMIVTELGLPHIIRSDNGPCYNSKEFQQFRQCYSITHHSRRACTQDLSLAILHPHFKVQLAFQVPTIQGTFILQPKA